MTKKTERVTKNVTFDLYLQTPMNKDAILYMLYIYKLYIYI